jgi:hypothetical protein
MVHDGRPVLSDERTVLRVCGLQKSDARELADNVGGEASVVADASLPVGGYGDLGTRTVAVAVTRRTLHAVARYFASRQYSRSETVSLIVEIDDADGTRHKRTLTYRAEPGQSTVEAAENAFRGLPGISDALERSLW